MPAGEVRLSPSEAVRALLGAWELGDPDLAANLFAEDGVFDDPLQPRRRVGPRDIRAACAGGMAKLRFCRIPIRLLIEREDIAVVEASFESELADGGGRFDFPFTLVLEMKDGKVARVAEYFDTRRLVPSHG